MPNSQVCVDANIVVKIVSPEELRPQALALWQSWLNTEREVVAPRLLSYEVTSVLRRKAARGLLTLDEARGALEAALALPITLLDPPNLAQHAFELATRFNLPTTYDCHYLALAEHLDCHLWTADERLHNASKDQFPRIRWLGDYPSAAR
jgi:predicted nucleic acid-binding protein